MVSLSRLRQHPVYAPAFRHVHPLCWLIHWWELIRLFGWFDGYPADSVLVSVSRWGRIQIRYIAPKTDPRAYTRPARTFRVLTDPSWESDLPACLELEPELVLRVGEMSPQRGPVALSLIPNTS